ncbi:hypothetical protein BCR44DRAFT_37921 [Catenaria anguillulae PL171]|uniref:Kinase n=1 Tax=Catenaria anguillulae PL171 TaxID=765915 RepID=A0A1Y2HFB0_9FUNG|nr:hypothetical protein BCR44DRAFT_37921 [Catenaria anguillulae PL171]
MKKLENQVAGHDSLLVLDNGTLAKPCPAKERQFYVDAIAAKSPMLTFMPAYLGDIDPAADALGHIRMDRPMPFIIKLSNLLEGIKTPSVMDLKMGTQLHEDDAPEAKRDHMIQLSQSTTNGSVGLRVSGMRLYNPKDQSFVAYDKSFGKSLNASTICLAFLEFTKFVACANNRLALLHSIHGQLSTFLKHADSLDGKFIGTSLFLVFDQEMADGADTGGAFRLHWIDFAHSEYSRGAAKRDQQFLFGVQNAIKAVQDAMGQLVN